MAGLGATRANERHVLAHQRRLQRQRDAREVLEPLALGPVRAAQRQPQTVRDHLNPTRSQ